MSSNLPKDWQVRQLGEIARAQAGFAFKSEFFTHDKGIPLIRIRDLKTNDPECRYGGNFGREFIVLPGELLIGMDGEFRCYRWAGPESLLNQRVCRLMFKTSEVVPDFVLYAINAHLRRIEEQTAFATVKHISTKQIEAIEMAIPPFDEQRRIVARIEEFNQRIEKAKRLGAEVSTELSEFFPLHSDALLHELDSPVRPFGELILDARNGFG